MTKNVIIDKKCIINNSIFNYSNNNTMSGLYKMKIAGVWKIKCALLSVFILKKVITEILL